MTGFISMIEMQNRNHSLPEKQERVVINRLETQQGTAATHKLRSQV